MPAPFISVNDLIMNFGGTKVLNKLSFEIPEGDIVRIIGRSGAGKSVLMHLLRGVEEPPTGGSIIYHVALCDHCDFLDVQSRAGKTCPACGGRLVAADVDLWDPNGNGMKSQIMRRTAIMFQRSFTLYGDDRVIENVIHALDDINYPQEHAIDRAADFIDQVLIKEPRLVILDEPTGTMDPITKQDVKHTILNALDETDETFIVVSHDMDFVRDVCDRVALMRSGKMIDIGPPLAILAQVTEDERQN